eukprot:544460-Pyramimonas_sp.AAC.1
MNPAGDPVHSAPPARSRGSMRTSSDSLWRPPKNSSSPSSSQRASAVTSSQPGRPMAGVVAAPEP